MKRISIVAAILLMGATGLTKAHSFYWGRGHWDHRVRWSVYTHSLVPGDLYYSPYAYRNGHSGLVPYWVRYSPYAFGTNHSSGLVNDHASSISSIYYVPDGRRYADSIRIVHAGRRDGLHCSSRADVHQKPASYAQMVEARRNQIRQLAKSGRRERATGETGGSQIIAAYLKSKNIDFRTNRLLQIAGKTISVDFLLTDRNVMVKYWDPIEILALDQQAEYRKRAYEDYLESWKDFCGQYQRAGGTVYSIISADSGEILAGLTDCSELNGEERTYALAQDNAAIIDEQQ
ncbi:MAG: hypothetical protein JSW66_03055 [Phycisphaerales bacterium]|nr:MAG: hypothetical protein JSW66_03055 [Phycisphaerales bacterium]